MTTSTNFCEKNLEITENVFFIRIEEEEKINILLKEVLVCLEVSHVTAVFSYKFLVNDYATSFKLKIQFDHFWS